MHTQREPIDRGFNVAVNHIASRLFPCGFDVTDNAPSTLEALQEHVTKTGRMAVWSGASDRTIFADPETNYAFRAWHDHCHLRGNHPFTPAGEYLAMEEQKSDLAKLYGADDPRVAKWCRLLDIEVMGQLDYAQRHDGQFPPDQWEFAREQLGH